ncbi:MAG: hypothetical protein SGI73_05010 [Chloroflexota bacterium]|nr:hypothetical protein [Chloroflexota bacterium]
MRTTKNLGALEHKSRRMRVTHQMRMPDGGRLLTVFDPEALSVHQVNIHFGRRGRRHTVFAICDCKWNRGDDGTLRGFGCAHSICALKTLGRDKRKILHFYNDADAARQQKRRLFLWYADEMSVSADEAAGNAALYITSRTG